MNAAKISVAKKAIGYIEKKLSDSTVLGIGTGSTVNFFIEASRNSNPIFIFDYTISKKN